MNLVLPVALPLLAAFMLPLVARIHPRLGQWFGPSVVAANLIVALLLRQQGLADGPRLEAMGGFPAPLGIVFYADQLALLMVIAVTALTLLLWPKGDRDPVREPTLTLLLLGGSCGIALSGDLFNLFVFYELVAVASYGLIASAGSGASQLATIRFLLLSATGSAMALLGIGLVYSVTGTLNLAQLATTPPGLLDGAVGVSAFALMLIGFGVKAELFPVNTWVPEVYAATTSRVSGLLAGVVSKLALLILLKLLLSVFDMAAAHQLLLIIGMLTLLSGELAAFQARDLRRVLAYSSIAQLGMVAIGFAISGSAGVMAGLAIALHHYLAKPALFLLAEKWGGQLTLLAGASTNAKLGTGVFVLIALSLIGVPPLPGFWAKYLLISALFNDGQDLAYLAVALLLITTIIEAAYLVRIGARLFETGPSRLEPHAKCELVPASILAVYLVAATLFAAPIYDGLSTVADQALDPGAYHAALPANPIAMEDRP